jgi:hypothetical protein
MPSVRITKTNIDRDTLTLVHAIASTHGISTTNMLEKMILYYVNNETKKN